jgi:hypothetical protein
MAHGPPPPGVPRWLHRLFSRWLGFVTVYLILAATATVLLVVILLVIVLVTEL